MTIAPSSNIILLKTPMELSDNNQLTWSTLQEQYEYFSNLPHLELIEATYLRKEGVIRFPTSANITYEDLLEYNYCMYQNEAYNEKWFYAYVTDINYINDGLTTIKIETDVWNSWWNDIILKQSFVEREHVNNDTIGTHTIPEGLETGEYICNSINSMDLGVLWYVVGATKQYDYSYVAGGGMYNGIYSGKTYYALRTSGDLENLIRQYDTDGHGEDIAEIFIVPAKLIGNPTYDSSHPVYRIPASTSIQSVTTINLSRPNSINNYTPRNKKLLVYPYQYLLVDNNGGNSVEFRYELFDNPASIDFDVKGSLTIGTSMSLLPKKYINSSGNTSTTPNMFNYALSLAKFPTCNWNTDLYINWCTQNAVNLQWNVVSNVGTTTLSGIKAGSPAGAIGSVAGGVLGAGIGAFKAINENMIQTHNQSFSPNQSKGNANSGDVITSAGANSPHFYKMSIKEEFARILDSYFDLFGYKVNQVKIPNIRGRRNWNYVKTIGCNLIGDIPQFDLQKIKELFDKGITLWHHTNTFLDYSQNNSII